MGVSVPPPLPGFIVRPRRKRGGFIGLKGKKGFFLSCSGKKDNIAQVF